MKQPLELTTFLMAFIAIALGSNAPAEELTGSQIYLQLCARCHGAEGEGTKKEYPQPLVGKRSLEQLARYIAKSMPEDDPCKLKPAEAQRVSEYIFDTFYSPAAQSRQK